MKSDPRRGFTLAEMVVVLSIISIMAVIILGNRNQYTERLSLKSETYKTSLYIRQAQVNSLNVKGFTKGPNPTNFGASYGVHFDADYPNDEFKFFADENNNGRLDDPLENTSNSETAKLSNGVVISSVCGNNGATCFGGSFNEMSIVFKRPESVARIRFMDGSGNNIAGINPPATINLRSKNGINSTIKIDASGGISILGI